MFRRAPSDSWGVGTANASRAFVMPDGLPAIAAGDGIVWSAGWSQRGFQIVIDHGKPSGVATYYQHLTKLFVAPTARAKAGQRVKAGDPLGIIGGDPKDPRGLKHLHFEIWRGPPSKAVDPAPLMRSWKFLPEPPATPA